MLKRLIGSAVVVFAFAGCSDSPSGALPVAPTAPVAAQPTVPPVRNPAAPAAPPAHAAAPQSFDFSFALPDLEGNTVSLANFKGKVVIVDVWGTWCPPCRMEIPHFVELQKKYRDAGLEIVGINYERVPADQWRDTIKKFVEENGVTYTCVIGDAATQQSIPNFNAYPTTLFVDRAGKVRQTLVGAHELSVLEGIVGPLLAERGSTPATN